MNDNKKYLLFYHLEDNDGVFSGALIYRFMINNLHINPDNITTKGVTYNILKEKYSDFEWICETYDSVIMTDISFNDIKMMKNLYKHYGNSFLWFDHHKPVIEASKVFEFDEALGIRDSSRSAILNVYHYFYDEFDEKYKKGEAPKLLRILSAYDSWSWEQEGFTDDYVKNINKAITYLSNLNFDVVLEFISNAGNNLEFDKVCDYDEFYNLGQQLNNYDLINADKQIEQYGECCWTVNGRPAVMIMLQGPTSSVLFKNASKIFNKELKNAIVLKYDKGNWVVSLYNINNDSSFHCGEYLKKNYNGGGHEGAAGCTISMAQFNKIIKTKKL